MYTSSFGTSYGYMGYNPSNVYSSTFTDPARNRSFSELAAGSYRQCLKCAAALPVAQFNINSVVCDQCSGSSAAVGYQANGYQYAPPSTASPAVTVPSGPAFQYTPALPAAAKVVLQRAATAIAATAAPPAPAVPAIMPPPAPTPAPAPEVPPTPFPASGTKYDAVVIGSGPGGEAAAVLCSQLGGRVAILEKKTLFGGPTGLTSKATRHVIKTILATAGTLEGQRDAIMTKMWGGFLDLLKAAMLGMTKEVRGRLEQNRAQLVNVDDAKVSLNGTRVTIRRGNETAVLQTKNVIIATGSRPARPAFIPFTPDKVVDPAEVAIVFATKLRLPESIGIIGGGIVAVEYALMLSTVGVKVVMFTPADEFMKIVPVVLRNEILATLKKGGVQIVTDKIENLRIVPGDQSAVISKGSKYAFELVLYARGRDANSEGLGLEAMGVQLGKYGRIDVDANFQSSLPNIYAIGDVAGGRLASTASKAGRAVAKYIFRGITDDQSPQLFASKFEDLPLCLWTVPEMASVGVTEEQLQAKGLRLADEGGPIVVGLARYDNLVQGRLAGGEGFVQLIAHYTPQERHRIIGASIFGPYANDLIQVIAMLISTHGTLELIANTPWAAVTMSVLLQHAADDALFRSPYFHPESTMPTGSPCAKYNKTW